MAMKEYSTLSISSELEPHNRMQFSVIPRKPHFWRVEYIQRVLNLADKAVYPLNVNTEGNIVIEVTDKSYLQKFFCFTFILSWNAKNEMSAVLQVSLYYMINEL